MSFSFGVSPFLLVISVLAAAVLTYWMYRRTTPAIATWKRIVLGGLRFFALFILIFLIFQPILRRIERESRPPVLAVLVDDSQSLSVVASRGDTSETSAVTRIRTFLKSLPVSSQQIRGDARVYAFSSNVSRLRQTSDTWVDSLDFNGSRTDIAQALEFVREDLKDQNLRGILLVSDGQYNTGRNPLYVADKFPVPIYTAAVGDTAAQRDLLVRRVVTNDIAYVDTEQPVQATLQAEGYENEQVTVSLLRQGQVVASTRVQLPEGNTEVPISFTYTPDAVGMQTMSVEVSHLQNELTYRNNEESFAVRVLERKKRILLLGAAPDPDLGAIRQILERNKDTEVNVFVQKDARSFYQGTLPEDFGAFEAIILSGYPGRSADPQVLQRIARAAEGGTPLLFLIGRQTDVNLLQGELSDYLPVISEAPRASFVEATFIPTTEGMRDPILSVNEAGMQPWRRLPPLTYNESRWRPSPDARIMATIEVRGVALEDPVLVVRRRAGHRSAALLGAGTWRWKNVPEDLADLENVWPTLLSNLIEWVTAREDDRLVRIEPDAEVFGGGEPVRLTGQVYDESLHPVNDAAIEVEVVAPDSTKYPYLMNPVGNGRYVLDAGTMPEGTYRYTATATRDGATLGTDEGTFAIGALTLEFKETRANVPLLRQIAQRSRGTFLLSEDLDQLPDVLSASGNFTEVHYEQEQEIRLWQLYSFLVLIIVLLTFEWFLRKRSGMV